MGTFLGVLGIMALAALLLGLWFWLDARGRCGGWTGCSPLPSTAALGRRA